MILTNEALKALFETGDTLDQTAFENLIDTAVQEGAFSALVDAAVINIDCEIKKQTNKTLTTALGREFTISNLSDGNEITMQVTLNAASATFTFPADSLCVADGTPSGDNTLPLVGTSGDVYMVAIKRVGTAYRVCAVNFGQ